jgi:hypothetical protein
MGFRNFGFMNYNVTYHAAKSTNTMEQLYIVTSVAKLTRYYKRCKLMATTIGPARC